MCHNLTIAQPCWRSAECKSYGGYKEYFFDGETITGYELEKHIMLEEDEVSEAALQKTFAEILSKDFEPMAITSDDLKIAKRVV